MNSVLKSSFFLFFVLLIVYQIDIIHKKNVLLNNLKLFVVNQPCNLIIDKNADIETQQFNFEKFTAELRYLNPSSILKKHKKKYKKIFYFNFSVDNKVEIHIQKHENNFVITKVVESVEYKKWMDCLKSEF